METSVTPIATTITTVHSGGFYIDKPIDHEKIKLVVKTALRRLEATGVSFVAILRNTVHAYFSDLKLSIGIKLLNIIEESMREIQDGRKVALIATQQTVESRTYQQYIGRIGAEIIHS
jgi:aspartate racemase